MSFPYWLASLSLYENMFVLLLLETITITPLALKLFNSVQEENDSIRHCVSLLYCGLFHIKYICEVHLKEVTAEAVSALIRLSLWQLAQKFNICSLKFLDLLKTRLLRKREVLSFSATSWGCDFLQYTWVKLIAHSRKAWSDLPSNGAHQAELCLLREWRIVGVAPTPS